MLQECGAYETELYEKIQGSCNKKSVNIQNIFSFQNIFPCMYILHFMELVYRKYYSNLAKIFILRLIKMGESLKDFSKFSKHTDFRKKKWFRPQQPVKVMLAVPTSLAKFHLHDMILVYTGWNDKIVTLEKTTWFHFR